MPRTTTTIATRSLALMTLATLTLSTAPGAAAEPAATHDAAAKLRADLEGLGGELIREEVTHVTSAASDSRYVPNLSVRAGWRVLLADTGFDVDPWIGLGWGFGNQVEFIHAEPQDTAAQRGLFGAEPRFTRPQNALVVDRSFLARPVAQGDAGLASVLDRHAEMHLERLPTRAILEGRLPGHVARELSGGELTIEAAAATFGRSVRTLQRQLDAEGTTFGAVVEEVRGALAKQYLAERDVAIAEVAFLLGYSEPSAFHRASSAGRGAPRARIVRPPRLRWARERADERMVGTTSERVCR